MTVTDILSVQAYFSLLGLQVLCHQVKHGPAHSIGKQEGERTHKNGIRNQNLVVAPHQKSCNVGNYQTKKADWPDDRRGNTGKQNRNGRDDAAPVYIQPQRTGSPSLQLKQIAGTAYQKAQCQPDQRINAQGS